MNIATINAFEHSEHGIVLITDAANQEAISYVEALNALDEGSFDSDLIFGFELVFALCNGEGDGFFKPTHQQRVTLWRWIVAASFVAEQADNNGTYQVDNGEGKTISAAIYRSEHTALTVYPSSERILLANHVEGVVYELYGAESGALMVMNLYRDFIAPEPKRGNRLSDAGREGLSLLHDDLIRAIEAGELNDIVTVH